MNTSHSYQSIRHIILGMVLYSFLAVSSVHAETINCTAITSLPTTITTQGVYCFTGHLSTSVTSGNAITINTNNVTIDMNGYKLGGLGAGDATAAIGIYALQRKNIVIRNGSIRGFFRGIHLNDFTPFTTSQGHVVRGMNLDGNTFMGISVHGRGMTIKNNQVVDTGGTTINNFAYGIVVQGSGNNLLNNQISSTTSISSRSAGINLSSADNAMVKDNRINQVNSASGPTTGIYITGSTDVIVRNSLISTAGEGIVYAAGSTGLYGSNYTSSVTTPFTGGTAAGTSNHTNP